MNFQMIYPLYPLSNKIFRNSKNPHFPIFWLPICPFWKQLPWSSPNGNIGGKRGVSVQTGPEAVWPDGWRAQGKLSSRWMSGRRMWFGCWQLAHGGSPSKLCWFYFGGKIPEVSHANVSEFLYSAMSRNQNNGFCGLGKK